MRYTIFSKRCLFVVLGMFLFQLYDASSALAYLQPFAVQDVRIDAGKIRVIGTYFNDAMGERRIDMVYMDIRFSAADAREIRIADSNTSKMLRLLSLRSGSEMTLDLTLAALDAYGEADREVIVGAIRDKTWSAPPEKNYVETLMAWR